MCCAGTIEFSSIARMFDFDLVVLALFSCLDFMSNSHMIRANNMTYCKESKTICLGIVKASPLPFQIARDG